MYYLCGRIYTLIIKAQQNMEISNSTKAYKAPQVKVSEMKVQSMLCQSQLGQNTEKFGMSGNSYDDDDWE